jgi:hypothetical protein
MYLAGSIGLLFSTSFFDAQECNLYASQYEEEWASGNMIGCDSFVLDVLTFQQLPNAVYAFLFLSPVLVGTMMMHLSLRRTHSASFSHWMVALLACMIALPVVFFFGIWGFIDNQYFLDSKCPSNADEIGFDCSFLRTRYTLIQIENVINLGLSLAIGVSALFYIRQTYDMIDGYETART